MGNTLDIPLCAGVRKSGPADDKTIKDGTNTPNSKMIEPGISISTDGSASELLNEEEKSDIKSLKEEILRLQRNLDAKEKEVKRVSSIASALQGRLSLIEEAESADSFVAAASTNSSSKSSCSNKEYEQKSEEEQDQDSSSSSEEDSSSRRLSRRLPTFLDGLGLEEEEEESFEKEAFLNDETEQPVAEQEPPFQTYILKAEQDTCIGKQRSWKSNFEKETMLDSTLLTKAVTIDDYARILASGQTRKS